MVLADRSGDVRRATRPVWLPVAEVVVAHRIDQETAGELVGDLDGGPQEHALLLLAHRRAPPPPVAEHCRVKETGIEGRPRIVLRCAVAPRPQAVPEVDRPKMPHDGVEVDDSNRPSRVVEQDIRDLQITMDDLLSFQSRVFCQNDPRRRGEYILGDVTYRPGQLGHHAAELVEHVGRVVEMFDAPLWLERETAKMTMHLPHDPTRFHRRVGGFDRVEHTAGDEGIEPPSSTRAVPRRELTVPGSDEPGYAHAAFRKMLGDGAHVLDGFGGHDLVQP